MTYNKAKHRNIEILTKLLYELYEDVTYEDLLTENKTLLDDSNQAFFLAFDGDTAIGVSHVTRRHEYVNGKEYDSPCGYLEAIYVRPTHRKQGIAAKLVAICENWTQEHGCREFLSDCLTDNVDSFKFHLRLGFIETERCIFFRKELE